MFIFNFIWYDPIIYVHNILIDNQFNWRISPFVIHRRSWITRFLFLAKTMDHAKNSGFSKLWLLWRRSLAFFCPLRFRGFVYCSAMNTCIYIVFTYFFLFHWRSTSWLFIQTISFFTAQTNRKISSIHCQIVILSILHVHVGLYVSIRNYNMA